jgi:hypothetical protein
MPTVVSSQVERPAGLPASTSRCFKDRRFMVARFDGVRLILSTRRYLSRLVAERDRNQQAGRLPTSPGLQYRMPVVSGLAQRKQVAEKRRPNTAFNAA